MAKSIPVLEGVTASRQIPLQETSLEIWDSKYRLKSKDGAPIDGSIDETYQRVARALAAQEREPDTWYAPSCGPCAMVPFRRAVSPPTPGRLSTSRRPPPSTAPSPAPLRIRWTISSARCTRRG